MKDAKIEVPAVAWWALIALLIPVLQVWIEGTFPGSACVWAPLVVAALGAVLKWISWLMEQNEQNLPGDDDAPTPSMSAAGDEYSLEWSKPKKQFDAAEFFFGIKRA